MSMPKSGVARQIPYLFDDITFNEIYNKHFVLYSCSNDLGGALGRETHTSQVFHIIGSAIRQPPTKSFSSTTIALYMPYRGPSPHRHVHIFGPQYHNAFFVDEDLSYWAIGSEVGFEGSISLKLGAVEGSYTSLEPLDIRRVLLEV